MTIRPILLGFFVLILLTRGPSPVAFAQTSVADDPPFLLQMIRNKAVHRELKLTEKQKSEVDAAIAEVDPRWWVSRILLVEKQASEIGELTDILQKRLDSSLQPNQQQRLGELVRQAYGTRLFRLDRVIDSLSITDEQQHRFETLFQKTDARSTQLQNDLTAKKISAADAEAALTDAKDQERQAIVKILTPKQQSGIRALIGDPFDFAQIKCTYPGAPEFVGDGSQWIDDQAVQMSDLRGKVVVVYFYAFQCINCQRNFPHYRAWHADMADRGLVVVGIQTPETSAERDFDRVVTAKRDDHFDFPVLFDQASTNWRAWGNTMWPTTYLVDKQGFIRRWWQGEMNWQGTLGEQQMRETIETLLAETD